MGGHCTRSLLYSLYFVDLPHVRARMHVRVHVHVPRCWARSSSGCASCCATARDAPRCAPTIHPPTTSRTTRTASRYASILWCTCTRVYAHMHSSHALCRLRSTGTSRRRSILKRTGPPPRPARARSTCPSSRKSSTSSRSSSERSTSSRRRIAAGAAQNSTTPDCSLRAICGTYLYVRLYKIFTGGVCFHIPARSGRTRGEPSGRKYLAA